MSRYTVHPGTTVLLEPRYCGSIAWYAALASHEHAIVDYSARYDKRHKLTHRTTIADVNGRLDLTVPINHPDGVQRQGGLTWADMTLSTHGAWWNVHRVAMESAYGRTPFFEFYVDRFAPAWSPDVCDNIRTLQNLDQLIDNAVRELLDLPPDIETPVGEVIDMTRNEPADLHPALPYWQVRADRLGFLPNLSILDLLFNLGPESRLWLRSHLNTMS